MRWFDHESCVRSVEQTTRHGEERMSTPRDGLDIERPTREHRYENAALYMSMKSPRFTTPRISKATAQRIKEALNNSPVMALGERGEAVKVVQQALIDLGDVRIAIPDGATGYFGKQTFDAVVAFQKAGRLVSTNGQVGNETLGKFGRVVCQRSDRSEGGGRGRGHRTGGDQHPQAATAEGRRLLLGYRGDDDVLLEA